MLRAHIHSPYHLFAVLMSSSQSTNSGACFLQDSTLTKIFQIVAQSGVTNSAHRKRSRAGNRAKRVLDPNYVPRPPNAFILFRTDWIKKNNSLLNGTQKKHLSKVVGSLWRSLSKEEKLPWEKLAETCKAIHREQHPNYKFKPIRDKEKEKEKKKIKKKPSKKFSSVATVPENRNSTSPLPLSPEAIIPLDHEKAFIPEDYVLVSTPESPHHTPPQHGGHCDLSTPQLQSTPNPGGSSNHSSATQYGPLASKFSSTWGHSFRTVESHSPHQSTPAVLGHSLQYHTEGSSRSPSNNGGYSLSANQEEHRTFFHSVRCTTLSQIAIYEFIEYMTRIRTLASQFLRYISLESSPTH